MTTTLPSGATYRIDSCEWYENPRDDYDHFAVLACRNDHRHLQLGDKDHEFDLGEFANADEIRQDLIVTESAIEASILPLYLMDHSGLTLRIGHGFGDVDPQGWDWAFIGFVYTTPDLMAQAWGDTPWTDEDAEGLARAEATEYGQYLSGDIYSYVASDSTGTLTDSCGGLYGYDNAVSEAAAAAEALERQARADAAERAARLDAEVDAWATLCGSLA